MTCDWSMGEMIPDLDQEQSKLYVESEVLPTIGMQYIMILTLEDLMEQTKV
jgi:hypothetical protein